MNLESIKASLAKIPAWVKANPKKAAVVAVVVVVIAYFAIKRGSQESGDTSAAPGEESLDSLGGGLGASELTSGGGGSSATSPGTTSGSGETTTTITESGGGGFSGGGFSESDFSISDTPSGFVNTAPAFSGSSAAIVAAPVAAFRPASEMTGIKSPVTSAGIANKPAIIRPTATPVMAPKVNNTVRAAVKTPVIVTKTDAEKAGLSKYYTGVSGGRRYVAGVFVGTVAGATIRRSEKI